MSVKFRIIHYILFNLLEDLMILWPNYIYPYILPLAMKIQFIKFTFNSHIV